MHKLFPASYLNFITQCEATAAMLLPSGVPYATGRVRELLPDKRDLPRTIRRLPLLSPRRDECTHYCGWRKCHGQRPCKWSAARTRLSQLRGEDKTKALVMIHITGHKGFGLTPDSSRPMGQIRRNSRRPAPRISYGSCLLTANTCN